MRRTTAPQNTLDNLKKEAKRWLQALRANDAEARARLDRVVPDAPAIPALRHVQHALAREHGHSGWAALKNQIVNQPSPESADDASHAELVARFIEYACPDHRVRTGSAHAIARNAAERILKRHPAIARDSLPTAVVCGDFDEVERILTARPGAANEKGGPKGWEPLLYLCFTRLSISAVTDNAVSIARALLDRGADPTVYFMAGDSRYTPLVGAIGEGEENRLPHPRRDELVRLLLERGAEPYDIQVFYNIHFHGDMLWWMKLVYETSVRLGRRGDWDDPEWWMINMGGYGSGARLLLEAAVGNNDLELAEWVLAHGATPEPAPSKSPKRGPQPTMPEAALRYGSTELARLLEQHGAKPSSYVHTGEEAFAAACMRLDRAAAQAMLERHPEYLRSPLAMHAAAKRDRADVVQLLLDLGVSPDVEDPKEGKQRALHVAAYEDSPDVARLLIERGAAVDPVETNWENTPLYTAVYAEKPRMIELIGRYSRDVWNLVFTGNVERLRELLRTEPELARLAGDDGATPLMWLPDDEARAMEIVELFVAHGADPAARIKDGRSAAGFARQRGMDDVVALLLALTRR